MTKSPALWRRALRTCRRPCGRNNEGLSVRGFVKRELKRNAKDKKRLSTRFWCRVNEEFELVESLADGLIDPPDGPVDMQLLEMLQVAFRW